MNIFIFLIIATVFLAYSNGANDNFKGVATLFGTNTTNYKKAITWATITTFAGSICSIFLAEKLIKQFSGKGLVPDLVATSPEFLTAVALGAALTVILATFIGFPISTTHGITGALVGAGVMAVGSQINLSILGNKFFLPLIASPFIAFALSGLLYAFFRMTRVKLGIQREYCLCIGETEQVVPVAEKLGSFSMSALKAPEVKIAQEKECHQRYVGNFLGINCQALLDVAHFMSAGVVSFARGLNDTPKIVALLLAVKALGITKGMLIVGIAMAIGGLINSRKVAETMSKRITKMNHGQGFTANLITGFLVIFASGWGLPVSTTHASCGAIFGIGVVTGQGDTKVISKIILSWVLTLPIAAILAGSIYGLLS